ncbi:MAG: hypothetical protein H7X99_09175 [Saprospiraceae bacterium]|nr:hypothetical protein [Saprospiraceae bacterium]
MKNYFRRFINLSILLVFMMISWGCPDGIEKSGTYPSPENWPQNCSFFTPFTVQYDAFFNVKEKTPVGLRGVPNAKVTCKLISVVRLPHPFIPDSCYQKTSVTTTFTLFTIDEGVFLGTQNKIFNFTFGSTGDYFILEVVVEKAGYYRQLKSKDFRYFYDQFDMKWIPHNTDLGPQYYERNLKIDLELLAENTNP